MQGNINSASGRLAVVAKQAKKRIKRRSRIRIQERVPQPRLADLAYRQILPLVQGITKACFPVPSLEIIAKLSHLTAEANVKEGIPVGELFTSLAGVVDAAKLNTCSYRQTASVRKVIWNSRICDRERIERILDWHTDAIRTKAHVEAWDLEWIRHKRHSCQGRIEKRTDKFKVGKHLQVFVADVANERPVVRLAIGWRKCRRESREVIQEVVAAPFIISAELWDVLEGIGPNDTGRTWICIWIDTRKRQERKSGALVKWRSCRVRS